MIKLFVDDLRPEPAGWVVARTVTRAIRLLATQEVGEVSLDHDICHAILPDDAMRPSQIYQPVCCPETFECVARYIIMMPKNRRPIVRIHTANPAGRKIMEDILASGE